MSVCYAPDRDGRMLHELRARSTTPAARSGSTSSSAAPAGTWSLVSSIDHDRDHQHLQRRRQHPARLPALRRRGLQRGRGRGGGRAGGAAGAVRAGRGPAGPADRRADRRRGPRGRRRGRRRCRAVRVPGRPGAATRRRHRAHGRGARRPARTARARTRSTSAASRSRPRCAPAAGASCRCWPPSGSRTRTRWCGGWWPPSADRRSRRRSAGATPGRHRARMTPCTTTGVLVAVVVGTGLGRSLALRAVDGRRSWRRTDRCGHLPPIAAAVLPPHEDRGARPTCRGPATALRWRSWSNRRAQRGDEPTSPGRLRPRPSGPSRTREFGVTVSPRRPTAAPGTATRPRRRAAGCRG